LWTTHHQALSSFGSLFGTLSLFVLGGSMVNAVDLADTDFLFLVTLLLCGKLLLLPIVSYMFVGVLGDDAAGRELAYLVGTFPVGEWARLIALSMKVRHGPSHRSQKRFYGMHTSCHPSHCRHGSPHGAAVRPALP
jgi:predicted permease